MEIKALVKAMPGDRVQVKNYRSSLGTWERGTVKQAKIILAGPREVVAQVSYDVLLDRKDRHGQSMWLYVNDSQIERDVEKLL